jgi:hypothetical protein
MSDDERPRKSFEESAREIAEEIKRSIERASQTDPEEYMRAAGVDPDRVREWVDAAGDWIRSQVEGAANTSDSRPGPPASRRSDEDVLREAGPHPLDVPTSEQGVALAALDSGRWVFEPETARLATRGGGPGPRNALGLVRELRDRDWIDGNGAVTVVGRHALERWLAQAEQN